MCFATCWTNAIYVAGRLTTSDDRPSRGMERFASLSSNMSARRIEPIAGPSDEYSLKKVTIVNVITGQWIFERAWHVLLASLLETM